MDNQTARRLNARLPVLPPDIMMMAVGEEAGEAMREYRRWKGWAKTHATAQRVAQELADVVLAAYLVADMHGLDLDAALARKVADLER